MRKPSSTGSSPRTFSLLPKPKLEGKIIAVRDYLAKEFDGAIKGARPSPLSSSAARAATARCAK